MSKPAPSALTLPRLPLGDDHHVRHLPVELLDDLDRDRLLSLEPQAVHRVGEVDAPLGGEPLHDGHAAVEVGVERQHRRAVGQRLHQLRGRHLAPRQDARWRGCRRRRRTRRATPTCRRSTRRRPPAPGCRRAIICLTIETSTVIPRSLNDPVCELPHCFTHRSSRPSARPKRSAQNRFVPPSSIETMFSSRIVGQHPFLLAPDRRAVRPRRALVALVEQASSTPRRSDRRAPRCRATPRAGRRTSGSGRWAVPSACSP